MCTSFVWRCPRIHYAIIGVAKAQVNNVIVACYDTVPIWESKFVHNANVQHGGCGKRGRNARAAYVNVIYKLLE